MIPADIDSPKTLKAWFKTLDAEGKKEHGRAFNERMAVLSEQAVKNQAAQPKPGKPRSKYFRKLKSILSKPRDSWTQEEADWLHDAAHCHICGRPSFPFCECGERRVNFMLFMAVGSWFSESINRQQ